MKSFFQNAKRWLPGAVISLILVTVVLRAVDLHATLNALRAANYKLLLAALLLNILWLLVRDNVWRTLLRNIPSYKAVLVSLGEGYLLNNILPFRLGELGRAFFLSKKSSLTFAEILPTIVIERIFDLLISAAIFITAVPFVADAQGTEQTAYWVGGIFLLVIAALYLLARNQAAALRLFDNMTIRFPTLNRSARGLAESFFSGLAALTDGWLFLRFLLWMLLNWTLAIMQYSLIVIALFPQATLIWGLFGLGAAAFGNAIPSLPGAIGTLEAAIGGSLSLLSGDMSTALAVALIVRLYNYFFSGVIGIYGLATEGETLSGIYTQLINFKKKQSPRSDDSGR